MRVQRYGFIFLACFLVLISGAYYYQVAALRTAHHAVVTLALLGYALWAWRRGGVPASPLTFPLLAAILLWIAAAALGVDARVGLENAWFPISHAVIALCLIDLIRRGRGGLVIETQFLLAAAVALFALIHLGSWYFGWGVAPGTAVGWAGVTAVAPLPLVLPMIFMPLGVSTWLAAYTAPLVLLSFAYGLSGRGAARIGLWALAAALLIALLATGSRGGLIALAAGAAALVGLTLIPDPSPTQAGRGEILSPPRPLWERGQGGEGRSPLRRLLPLAFAALIVAAALGVVYLIGGNAARFTGDALRFELWRGALAVGAEHPLLGVGTGMFGRVIRETRVFGGVYDNRLGTAHNAYLNTFAETGILGVGLMLVFGGVILWRFWRRWRALSVPGQGRIRAERVRLEGAFAALVGFGVQSLFDTFVVTPLALLTVVLVVLVAVEPGTVVEPVRRMRWAAPALALLIALYGVGQIRSDALYGQFRAAESLQDVQAVVDADPHMGVYAMQAAVLRHQVGGADADAADAAYAAALESAPTWDAGWMDRAALAEARGDDAAALDYLQRARAIDRFNGATLHWARIAERTGAAERSEVVDAYRLGFDYLNLPLSEFWGETPARLEAVGSLAAEWTLAAPDLAYRLLRVHAPEQLAALVAVVQAHDPPKPGDWWVLGEEALQSGDAAAAFDGMDRAARAARTNGDYYASRARARLALNPADPLIEIDLRLAELLGARYESPNAIRAEIAPDEEMRRRLWANAVPPQVVAQNFEGVSYAGRTVGFWIAPSMRPPGVGLAVLQPWVALADSYAAAGEVEAAEAVRRAIAERQ